MTSTMSFRKPGYVAFEWVEKNILSKLRDPRTDNQLLRDCEAAVNELKQSVPSVSEWLLKPVFKFTGSCFRVDGLTLRSLATCEFSGV